MANSAFTIGIPGGAVETISIASANGFSGTSDGDPINPELTISTTIGAGEIPLGNGTGGFIDAPVTGTGNIVLASSPTLSNPNIGNATGTTLSLTANSNQIILDSDGSFTGTLTTSALNGNRTWTFPNHSGTVVTQTGSVTLTNKTMDGGSNTFTNIAQSSITDLTTDLSAKAPLASPTFTGTVTLPEIAFDGTPNTDDTVNGPTTSTFNAGATIAQWDCVYLDSSSTWILADADAASTSGPVMLALAAASGTAGNPMKVALTGSFCRNDAWAWTVGGAIYVDTTAGGLSQTAPSGSGDIVRVAGYAMSADVIYFMPSGAWVEVT